jgi:hypothetical protein
MSEPTTAFTVVSPKEAPTREKPKEKQMSPEADLAADSPTLRVAIIEMVYTWSTTLTYTLSHLDILTGLVPPYGGACRASSLSSSLALLTPFR